MEKEGDDPLDWLRSSIPGEPGTDYPIMAATQVSVHMAMCCVSMTSSSRTVGSPAMVWCSAVTTQTLPLTANSTASACRTPSAPTPSTLSISSAPTAPSSTSSSSTATGGQFLSSTREGSSPDYVSGSTWTVRPLKACMGELREHLELQEVQEEERMQAPVQLPLLALLMSVLVLSPPAGVLGRETQTVLEMDSAA